MKKTTHPRSRVGEKYRSPAEYPGVVAAMRVDYEQNGLGLTRLKKKYGIPRSTIGLIIIREHWHKPGGFTEAADVATAILATGLRDTPLAANEVDRMPLNPALEYGPDPPEGPFFAEVNPGSDPVQKSEGYPPDNTSPPVVAPPPSTPPKGDKKKAKDPPTEPLPEAPDWVKGNRPAPPRTADIINFPKSPPVQPRQAAVVQMLPEQATQEKAQLRVALSAIKAMMTMEQVEQLEHHEALLRRYSHLIEVYLEPQRFVDLDGMDDDAKAEKIVATQKLAMGMLLPTERDTLAGALKTLTSAVQTTIALKRAVVGLQAVRGGTVVASNEPLFEEGRLEPGGTLIDMATLAVPQLRQVQEAMELLQRHQHAQKDAPKPPPPESIEDLRHPDFPAELDEEDDEPEVPR